VPPTERRGRAEKLLADIGLADRAHHKPGELSGGEQQRVAIARALANSPDLLLADEPTGNLDSATGAEVMNVLKRLHAAGHTLIMVTHDERIARHAQRVLRMIDGRWKTHSTETKT
jgi:ABC-type lipoprotein export system ATPase subunit